MEIEEDYKNEEKEQKYYEEEQKEIKYGDDNEHPPEIEEEDFDLEQIINKNIQKQLKKLNEDEEKTNVQTNKKSDEKDKQNLKEKRDELLMIKEEQGKKNFYKNKRKKL